MPENVKSWVTVWNGPRAAWVSVLQDEVPAWVPRSARDAYLIAAERQVRMSR